MVTVNLDLTPAKARLVACYVARMKTDLETVLLNQSVESIVQQEAYNAFQSLIAANNIPESIVVTAETLAGRVV